MNNWRTLEPIPDRVGFGGMFAGVLSGRLIAGGGSQFAGRPVWLKGNKVYSDRIFVLEREDVAWRESAHRLPIPSGHFASTATAGEIYLVGGASSDGFLAQVLVVFEARGSLAIEPLPDLPHPLAFAAAEIVHDRLYVVGGIDHPAAKSAQSGCWSIAIVRKRGQGETWRREPDLPSPGVFVCAAGSGAGCLFVIGGISFDSAGALAPSDRMLCFEPARRIWRELQRLPAARVGSASPVPMLLDNRFLVIGGYASVFAGPPRDHPGFCRQTLIYDINSDSWTEGPVLPATPVEDRDRPGDLGPGPMIAAPAVRWNKLIVIIGGEVRASVRTPAVVALEA